MTQTAYKQQVLLGLGLVASTGLKIKFNSKLSLRLTLVQD